MYGESKRDVFEKLIVAHPEAAEIRIRSALEKADARVLMMNDAERPHLHDVDRVVDCWCGARPNEPHIIQDEITLFDTDQHIVRRYKVSWTWDSGGSGAGLVLAYTAADAVTQASLQHGGAAGISYRVVPDPIKESLAARIETLETLTEQLAKNGDILHRQLRAEGQRLDQANTRADGVTKAICENSTHFAERMNSVINAGFWVRAKWLLFGTVPYEVARDQMFARVNAMGGTTQAQQHD